MSEPSPPLRAGLSGCGGVSRWTLEVARKSRDFRIVALQDPDRSAREGLARRYRVGCTTADFGELLAQRLDFVILNTPNHLHLQQVREAVRAGLHVLVQKPAGRTAAEARRMQDLSRRHRVKIGVSMMDLGDPQLIDLQNSVRRGLIGTPVLVQGLFAHDAYLKNPPAVRDWRRDVRNVGGASFIQLAIHPLNLAMEMLGRSIIAVAARSGSGRTVFKSDETTVASVVFEGGVLGTFVSSYATRGRSFSIRGTKGFIEVGDHGIRVQGIRACAMDRVPFFSEDSWRRWGKSDIHNRFARWIRDGEDFPSPIGAGVRDLEVVNAVYRSLRSGKVEKV